MTDRKRHWQKIYRGKSSREVSWFQKKPERSLALIRRSGVGLEAPIIDVGGGASTLAEHLYREGYTRISVLDISRQALECDRERLGKEVAAIEWYEADITEFSPPHDYALWHDRAVFHFLTAEADRKRYVQVLERSLSPGGYLVMAAFAIGGPETCSGLDIVQYDARKLMTELGDIFELLDQQEELHQTPAGAEQKFCYFFCWRTSC